MKKEFLVLAIILLAGCVRAANVTECGILTGDSPFTMNDSITTAGDCFTIGDNQILDCNYFTLTGDTSGAGVVLNGENATIQNCIIDSFAYGVKGEPSNNLSSFTLRNSQLLNSGAVSLYIALFPTEETLNYTLIENSTVGTTALSGNMYYADFINVTGMSIDYSNGDAIQWNVINSPLSALSWVPQIGNLFVYWYFDVNVTDSNSPLQSATITLQNNTGEITSSQSTDEGGIASFIPLDYYYLNTTRTDLNPYNISISLDGYISNSTNVTIDGSMSYPVILQSESTPTPTPEAINTGGGGGNSYVRTRSGIPTILPFTPSIVLKPDNNITIGIIVVAALLIMGFFYTTFTKR